MADFTHLQISSAYLAWLVASFIEISVRERQQSYLTFVLQRLQSVNIGQSSKWTRPEVATKTQECIIVLLYYYVLALYNTPNLTLALEMYQLLSCIRHLNGRFVALSNPAGESDD